MSVQVLDHISAAGSGGSQAFFWNPNAYRTDSIRVHVEIQGGNTDAQVQFRLYGRATDADTSDGGAPLHLIHEVLGDWETQGSPSYTQTRCNADGSAVFETTAFPCMKAEISAFAQGKIGVTPAAKAASTSALAFSGQPNSGDTFTLSDGFGNTVEFEFYEAGGSRSSDSAIEIGSDADGTVANTVVVINNYTDPANNSPSPSNPNAVGRPLYLSAADSGSTSVNLEVDVFGTTGNSATVATSATNVTAGTFSGGTGVDTYASVWIDEQL